MARDGIRVSVDRDDITPWFKALTKQVRPQARRVMREAAAAAQKYGRDLLLQRIYNTPQRGDYVRTWALYNSFRAQAEGNQHYASFFITMGEGLPRNYAPYVELGTFDQRITPEQAMRSVASSIEFGNAGKGLEPRPVIYPTLVWANLHMEIYVKLLIGRLDAEAFSQGVRR